jgi:hypothetical protein
MFKCWDVAPGRESQGQRGKINLREERTQNLCNGRYSQRRHKALVRLLLSGMDGKEQISD